MEHERVFPASYRLDSLAQLWERTFPQHEAFEKDGLHPKWHFATYMIEIAMLEADLRCPAFRHTREGQPIVIVLADGWNLEGMSRTKIELYQMINASVLDTATVGVQEQVPRLARALLRLLLQEVEVRGVEPYRAVDHPA